MEQSNLRTKYEAQYVRARGNLLAMLLLTLANVVLMIAEAQVSFLFSAILPQVARLPTAGIWMPGWGARLIPGLPM